MGNSRNVEKPSDKKIWLLINNPTYNINMLVHFLPDFFLYIFISGYLQAIYSLLPF